MDFGTMPLRGRGSAIRFAIEAAIAAIDDMALLAMPVFLFVFAIINAGRVNRGFANALEYFRYASGAVRQREARACRGTASQIRAYAAGRNRGRFLRRDLLLRATRSLRQSGFRDLSPVLTPPFKIFSPEADPREFLTQPLNPAAWCAARSDRHWPRKRNRRTGGGRSFSRSAGDRLPASVPKRRSGI